MGRGEVEEALRAASSELGATLRAVGEPLQDGGRAVVVRAAVDGGRRTVVVKTYRPSAGEGWVRESAALAVVAGRGVLAPALLAVGERPPLVVVEDLGAGTDVAAALLGADPDVAAAAVRDWAGAMAALHVATADAREGFAAALAARSGDLPVDVDTTASSLADAAGGLEQQLPELGVVPGRAALDELRGAGSLLASGPTALSPGDTCPDNTITTPAGLALLDFEGAAFRPVAWDLAYLAVPWPTCWCAWRLPAAVTDAALERWRERAADRWSAADLREGVDVAAVAWTFVSASLFLRRALDGDPPARIRGRTVPSRRAMIRHRLRGAVERDVAALPHLTALAAELVAATERAWGEEPLELAPAFR